MIRLFYHNFFADFVIKLKSDIDFCARVKYNKFVRIVHIFGIPIRTKIINEKVN